jgi:uncharacterized protein YecE (DUF72 family)
MPISENLYVGTSSWSCPDWAGPFYPPMLKPARFLEAYARCFRTVEIESTYYGVPERSVVMGWRERTPPDFVFAAKVPGTVTQEKLLRNCEAEFATFLSTMELLGDRLGPLLLQFPYFNRNAFASRNAFDKLLRPFLKSLPKDFRFAVEIRNKNWITWDFFELLRDHSVAFALVAQAWMPGIATLAKALDVATADFCYARFVGDPKSAGGDKGKWDKLVDDKTAEMNIWTSELKKIVSRGIRAYAFFNNHYAGFAPGSARLFEELWEKAAI